MKQEVSETRIIIKPYFKPQTFNASFTRSFNIIMTTLNVFILTFSPLISYAFSLLYLLLFSKYVTKHFRVINSVILIISMAIISASRLYFHTLSDDFIRYYETYTELLNGNYEFIFIYGNGLEWGLPLFYAGLAIIFQSKSPEFILFSETLLILIIFYGFLEHYFKNELSNSEMNQLIVTAFLFFSLPLATQVTRQFLAMNILLWAFSSKGKSNWYIVALATCFHVTALPIFILIRLIQRNAIFYGSITVVLSIFSIQFFPFILAFVGINNALTSKLAYYLYNTTNESPLPIVQLFFILTTTVGISFCKSAGFIKEWRSVLIVFSCIYISLLSLPLASLRFTILPISIMLGIFFFFSYKKYGVLFFVILGSYILYRFNGWININTDNLMHFWGNYSWVGTPFYYLLGD